MVAWLLAGAMFAAEPVVGEFNQYLYPSKTGLIAVIDLQIAKRSGFFDERLEQGFDNLLQGNAQLKQLSELLNFNPLEKLTKITICGSDQQQEQSFLLIVNGQFPYEKFSQTLDKMVDDGQLSLFDVKELNVYFNHRERKAMYFALIDQHTVIATPSKTWITDSIEGLAEFRTLDGDLTQRAEWKKEEPNQALRLSGLFPEQARRQIARNPQLAVIAPKLVGYNVSVQLQERPRFRVRLTMTDAEAADQTSLILNTLVRLGEAALANSERQDLLQMLRQLKIDPEDEHVIADVTISGDLFRTILQNNDERRERFRERRQRAEQENP